MTGGTHFSGIFRPSSVHASQRYFVRRSSAGRSAEAENSPRACARDSGDNSGSHDADDVSVVIYGEIYNSEALCGDLGLSRDTPLSQLLQIAWSHWSVDLLPRLDGVFTLALTVGDELLLYRDPSGLRGLYCYIGCNEQIAFASDLNALWALPGTKRRFARPSMHEYLRFLDVAPPNTLFKDVVAVEAGQLMRWSLSGIEVQSWPGSDAEAIVPTQWDEAIAQLDACLQRGVHARLEGAVHPAAFLSGGIDSSLICALAARKRADLTALTVGFENPRHDETPIAQLIATHLGIAHHVLRFGRGEYLAAFERLSRHLDQPMADPATPATLLALDHCRSHFDTVLDGTGADEAGGTMPPRYVRLAVGYASVLPVPLRRAVSRLLSTVPGLAGYMPILDFEHPAETLIRWRGFSRLEIEELCGEPVSFEHTQFYRTFARFPRRAHYERYSALMDTMPSERLTQAALISGMGVRYPFFDRATNRFLRQLPTEWRYLPGQPKRILRELLARYVPRAIWDVPKHGFNFPLHEFLAGDDFALVRRHVEQGRWLDRGLLRADVVRRYARQYIAGDRRLMFRVWALVVLGAWLEQHEDLN